jgi:RNA polymerase sigma-70 factor (sigma-E family)
MQRNAPSRCLLGVGGGVAVGLDFTRFVREHTADLLRTGYLLTGDGSAAEELVQDTLVRLYPKWQLVEAAEVPLAYVRRSLANGFVNHTRRAARREYAVEFLPESVDESDRSGQLDDRDEIWTMLRTLPERQRTALVLRYFHDLPDEDIAAALGCREGTVRSLISRGLAALRDHAHTGRTSA